jgi:hypothetical protein
MPWYPRDREFTEFEARMDFLFFRGLLTPTEAAFRWSWREERVCDFFNLLKAENMLNPPADMYEKDEDYKSIAADVVRMFNEIFDRSIEVTATRIKDVRLRIKDGRRQNPPVGLRQFQAVFEYKKAQWENDPKMCHHLEWETLCSAKHFQPYLEQARDAHKKKMQAKQHPPIEDGIRLNGRLKQQVLPQ